MKPTQVVLSLLLFGMCLILSPLLISVWLAMRANRIEVEEWHRKSRNASRGES